jgi:hypothetical protein
MGQTNKKNYFTVPENNRLLVTLNQLEITYCYQSVNVIPLPRSQSDHIKQLPLYIKDSYKTKYAPPVSQKERFYLK